ncbi:anti-sigma factor [Pelagibius sp.]|uniref:anti-sigma factor family protein n=1 Tax=Pelagibius sp. TaxID=1931238 RepID=UPI0026281E53|nr:zf-HC2 domain-containing protein [Pelagibius sp.]
MKGAMLRKLPLMITCREFEDFLLDYMEGSLPTRQRRIFEVHLAICRECREYLAAYRETIELGRQAFEDPAANPPEDVPEDLITAVLAARGGDPKG